jgi:SnoaL-like domain
MKRFRQAVEARDPEALVAALAEDVVFQSPIVFKPYRGREMVGHILRAVLRVFTEFEYVDAIGNDHGKSALEFKAKAGGREIHGIDLITVDPDSGLVTELTVFVRPLSGTQALMAGMQAELGLK